MADFKSLNLLPSILKALDAKGYTTPTPIQAQAIPHLLKGKDLLGIAQTGTGKTAAFSLPIINRLGQNRVRLRPKNIRTLILTPTRELATQIDDNVKSYGVGQNLSSKVVFGGVGKQPQVKALSRGIDILVATPGRLLDLMNEGHIKFDQLEVFVLDEADRMLDMGFIRDVQKIISKLPKVKQTLLFSATMPNDIARLAGSLLKSPVRVEVTPESTTVEKIDQRVQFVHKSHKPNLLIHVIKDNDLNCVLVFTRTKHGADKVVKKLDQASISAAAIHGNKSQNARERALSSFRSGKVKVLVATDIAARGIDIPEVTHIINFNLPDDSKSYVHRIGRTARAGREGVAISFCDAEELKLLKDIEKTIKCKIPIDIDHPFHGQAPKEIPENQRQNQNRNQGQNKSRPQNSRKKKPGNSKPNRRPGQASRPSNKS